MKKTADNNYYTRLDETNRTTSRILPPVGEERGRQAGRVTPPYSRKTKKDPPKHKGSEAGVSTMTALANRPHPQAPHPTKPPAQAPKTTSQAPDQRTQPNHQAPRLGYRATEATVISLFFL